MVAADPPPVDRISVLLATADRQQRTQGGRDGQVLLALTAGIDIDLRGARSVA